MEGLQFILGAALVVGVLKGGTYFVLLWACSIPTIPAVGKRVESAFWGTVLRVFLGVLTTPVFFVILTTVDRESAGWSLTAVHYGVRLTLWLVVAATVYRSAPFYTPAYRRYFTTCVAGAGTLLNLGWDFAFFGGSLLRPDLRWEC